MPLGTPSNLSLGKLGHIAGGNAGTTNQTSLNSCARDSGTAQTSMWADFKIGSISFNEVSFMEGTGTWEYASLILSIPNTGDVGAYMGSSSGGSDYYVSKTYNTSSDILHAGDDWTIEISETDAGSKYVDRIQNRSANASDYVFSKEHISGTNHTFSPSQISTQRDRFTLVTVE